jgi:hypothetical protein
MIDWLNLAMRFIICSMNKLFVHIYVIASLVIIVFLLTGCAQKGRPSGGPTDKINPTVTETHPLHGALEIDKNTQIEILFSERIKARDEDIFVSPSYPSFDKKITARRIILTPKDKLQSDVTYIVSLSSKIGDRESNPLDGGYQLAFSTGDKLDSLKIGGIALGRDLRPIKETAVLFFKTPIDSLRSPDYIAFTDSLGRFEANYIAEGEYIVGAFTRIDKDNIPDISKVYGISSGLVDVPPSANRLVIAMGNHDTSAVYVENIKSNDKRSILITFSQDILHNESINLDFTPPIDDLTLDRQFENDKMFFYKDSKIPAGSYKVKISGITSIDCRQIESDSIYLSISSKSDSFQQEITYRNPSTNDKHSPFDMMLARFVWPVQSANIILQSYEIERRTDIDDGGNEKVVRDSVFTDIAINSKLESPYLLVSTIDSISINDDVKKYRWRIESSMSIDGNNYNDSSWTYFTMNPKKSYGELFVRTNGSLCDGNELAVIVDKKGELFYLNPVDSGYTGKHIQEGEYQLVFFCDNGDSSICTGRLDQNGDVLFGEELRFIEEPVKIQGRWLTEIEVPSF